MRSLAKVVGGAGEWGERMRWWLAVKESSWEEEDVVEEEEHTHTYTHTQHRTSLLRMNSMWRSSTSLTQQVV
jgi:hypothetical protein